MLIVIVCIEVEHGLVLTCLGDPAPTSYKRTRSSNAAIDRLRRGRVARRRARPSSAYPFMPIGYDERQYCSPGFNLPVGCLMRSPGGTFPRASAHRLTTWIQFSPEYWQTRSVYCSGSCI